MSASQIDTECVVYRGPELEVEVYEQFLSSELASRVLARLLEKMPPSTRRKASVYGQEGLVYGVSYRGSQFSSCVQPWEELPLLKSLATIIERTLGYRTNVCVVQCYPDGNSGIGHHRDKEIKEGMPIIGLSVGATRFLEFKRPACKTLSVELGTGSLYLMKGRTNSGWTHSIPKDPSVSQPRYSLTFRSI